MQAMLTFHQSEFRWYWAPAALFTLYNILEYTVVLDLGAGVSQVVMQLKVRCLVCWTLRLYPEGVNLDEF